MTEATHEKPTTFSELVALADLGGQRYRGPAGPEESGGIYGGQLLAQSVAAAYRTVDDDRDVNSLQAYFMRGGDEGLPTDLHVEEIRDGRSFSFRCVQASQEGKELFRMMLSFQIEEVGPEFANPSIPKTPPPEEVPFTYADFKRLSESNDPNYQRTVDDSTGRRPMDLRYIDHPTEPPGVPVLDDQRMWMRIPETLGDEPAVHYAGLAYLSDSSLIDGVALPHGRRWYDHNATGVSLAHSMWFHRRPQADEWVLFDQRVDATGNNRGLVVGRIFDQSGTLIATAAQEGMIRWRDE